MTGTAQIPEPETGVSETFHVQQISAKLAPDDQQAAPEETTAPQQTDDPYMQYLYAFEEVTPEEALVKDTVAEEKDSVVHTVEPEATETPEPAVSWNDDEAQMLLRIAMAEAESETVAGKALVIRTVMNRVESDAFPDSIEEVLFQENQFTPVQPGGRYYTTEPDDGCREALYLVSTGWDESQGALYFESCGGSSWHSRNLEYLFQEGNHRFYK